MKYFLGQRKTQAAPECRTCKDSDWAGIHCGASLTRANTTPNSQFPFSPPALGTLAFAICALGDMGQRQGGSRPRSSIRMVRWTQGWASSSLRAPLSGGRSECCQERPCSSWGLTFVPGPAGPPSCPCIHPSWGHGVRGSSRPCRWPSPPRCLLDSTFSQGNGSPGYSRKVSVASETF